MLELERVRTHIASDLHDDIGSNLSLIAGLSEVLSDQAKRFDSEMTERLSMIASISRSSVDAMSDIVWAVNPMNDHLSDVIHRMRRFASDALGAQNIEFRFDTAVADGKTRVGAETRREVFLVFKESINNLVRHSGCTRADILLKAESGSITLKVSDNGRGFNSGASWPGHGLISIKKRAAKLGGTLDIRSSAASGTTIELRAPTQ